MEMPDLSANHSPPRTFRLTGLLFAVFVALTGTFFALTGPIDMIDGGPFGWHVRQPAFWQGGIELIVLAALVGTSLYMFSGWRRILITLVLCELYARRQGVDLAILITLFYYEGIAALGTLILNRWGRLLLSNAQKCLFGIVVGTLTWCCIEWILSALGPGSVHDLQVAALVVLGSSLLLVRRLPVLGFVFSNIGKRNPSDALLGTFVCTIVLMLFAKASVSIDYDSLWYGVRGDRVLVAAGSAFKGLGMVGPVHYAPQAYELLLVPLTRLRSVTAILGFSIWCWVSLGVCLYALAERWGWSRRAGLLAVALSLATPAVMNIAMTAKGDVMAAVWVFFAIYAIVSYQSTRRHWWLWAAVAAAAVATVFRMSTLIYAGLTGLFAFGLLLANASKQNTASETPVEVSTGTWCWLVCGATILLALVTLRTFLLAGAPFTEVSTLVNLAQRLGFVLKFPVGGPAPVYPAFNTDFVTVIFDFLFAPASLPHVIIGWTGSAFAYFLLIGAVLRTKRPGIRIGTSLLLLVVLGLMFPLLQLAIRFPIRGGDGNYFIVPIIAMILLGVGMVGENFFRRDSVGRALRYVVSLFLVSSVAVSLMTGSWGPGTRAWDFNFSRPAHDYPARAKYGIDTAGLQLIDQYLKDKPADTRAVGLIPPNPADTLPGSWLPVRYEELENIAWACPGYVRFPESIAAFLQLDDIQYVLLPKSEAGKDLHNELGQKSNAAMRILQMQGLATPVVVSADYVLWKLKH